MNDNNSKEHSRTATEAWADHKTYDPETHVSIPSEEAVEAAKEWVEGNEL
jgi:hypothetical protein